MHPLSNQPYKRPQQFEAPTPKRRKTDETDIPTFSSAHPGAAPDASDRHQAQSSLDIPLPPAESGPQTIPLVSFNAPPWHAVSAIRSGSTFNIADVPRIRSAGNALAVVNALSPEDLTSHSKMPFALIAQLFKVADSDTVLLSMLATRLLTLATTEHAMACVLASFLEAARQWLSAVSTRELVKCVDQFARARQDMFSTEQYLPLLQQFTDSAAEAERKLSADAEMPTVVVPHVVNATGTAPTGDAPQTNIVVPEGALVIPLQMPPQPVMQAHEIISIIPNAWDPAWTTKVFALLVPHVNPLAVEAPATLRRSAKPMADQARLNKPMKN